MAIELDQIYTTKAIYSNNRRTELRNRLSTIDAISKIDSLTVFCAGSYARNEASEHSDVDLFFLCNGDRSDEETPKTNELRLFGDLIDVAENMSFPRFSGDCRYLEIHDASQNLRALGSPEDDYDNHFTVRMLLLLESKPLFGERIYDGLIYEFIDSYFRDYPDHEATFEPHFLVNDIARYWRTLQANYEHRRNQRDFERHERASQKVKNYKLKYSRLTTCFATIAALASFDAPVKHDDVVSVISLTPRERLEGVAERMPAVEPIVAEVLELYAVFLKQTELTADELQSLFKDRQKTTELFAAANSYGDKVYELIDKIDQDSSRNIMRMLVI